MSQSEHLFHCLFHWDDFEVFFGKNLIEGDNLSIHLPFPNCPSFALLLSDEWFFNLIQNNPLLNFKWMMNKLLCNILKDLFFQKILFYWVEPHKLVYWLINYSFHKQKVSTDIFTIFHWQRFLHFKTDQVSLNYFWFLP